MQRNKAVSRTGAADMMPRHDVKSFLKRSAFLRFMLAKTRVVRREVAFVVSILASGRWLTYRKGILASQGLENQKVMSRMLQLPPFDDFGDLITWLKTNAIRYSEGGFSIYIPPQENAQKWFGAVLAAYPPATGLKILKDLKAPHVAIYTATGVNPGSPRLSDGISYRPSDYLRVANYLYDKGLGPRVYDLIELRTPTNSLTAYAVQHVAGTTPTPAEFSAFIERLRCLMADELVPTLSSWETAADFQCPDCRGNLIRDEATSDVMYVDFQGFMLRDPKRRVLTVANEIRADVHFGNPHVIRGGKYLYQSIPAVKTGKRDINTRWQVLRQALEQQGVPVEDSIVFDIGCNAGMMMSAALIAGAAWAVGWDRPAVAEAARKLLLATGMTRFDVFGQDISPDTNLVSMLPRHLRAGPDPLLFFLSMRRHIGFPRCVKELPFRYMVYEEHDGESAAALQDHLDDLVRDWELCVDSIIWYVDGDAGGERALAILHRR